jgi:hypothetical protein
MADKTEDESQAYQNFLALGSFASQLKTTIQAADTCFEKACTAQTHLAGQIQSYLSSELSGDADMPPGELYDFFNSSDATRLQAQTLHEISGKFYGACSELGNNALQAVLGQLEDLVIRPIVNDEEFAPMTKEILEEKKKATLDYDSFRRAAQNHNSPQEHEKIEAKLRAARDRYELATKRLDQHIDMRNQIRCKLLVHGILTAMQQYCNFYNHAINIFRDTALSIKPLLEVYQLSDSQLQTTLNLQEMQSNNDPRSPPKQNKAASSVFDDFAAQQNNHRPKAATAKSSAAAPARVTSPHIDDMMRDATINLAAKPAAQPPKNTPMNQYGATSKASPQPTHHGSPQPTHNPHQPIRHQSPPPHQAPPPTQPHIDLFDHPTPQRVHSPAPKPEILVDLNTSSNDLLFGGPIQTNMAPPMQPSNADPFASFATPSFTPSPINPKASNPPPPSSNPPPPDDLLFGSPMQPTPTRNFVPPTQQPPANDPFSFTSAPPTSAPKNPQNDFDDLFGPPKPTPANNSPSSAPKPGFTSPAAGFTSPPATVGAAAASKTQDERHELNPAVTNRINNWASRGGRQNNLRSLLSTLHEVIWVDSGWDALSLTDLITPAQVKKAYIRANLIVHPDKVQNGTIEQQLIAQRLFEALRVSYETFKDEPK